MKIKKTFLVLTVIIATILIGCASQRMSTITSCNYDESRNQTDYLLLPFGSVSIPGEWKKTNYNSVSGQQFFINKDSISIAITFNRFDKYEFNTNGLEKGDEFVKAFYDWDSKYFVDSYGLQSRVLEKDSINNFILYQIHGLTNGVKIDTYFFVAEKNGNVSNFSIQTTDKWSEEEKINFLKLLYMTD